MLFDNWEASAAENTGDLDSRNNARLSDKISTPVLQPSRLVCLTI